MSHCDDDLTVKPGLKYFPIIISADNVRHFEALCTSSVGIKCEKSRHQRKDAKRCEKSGKDAKRAMFYGRKADSAISCI